MSFFVISVFFFAAHCDPSAAAVHSAGNNFIEFLYCLHSLNGQSAERVREMRRLLLIVCFINDDVIIAAHATATAAAVLAAAAAGLIIYSLFYTII